MLHVDLRGCSAVCVHSGSLQRVCAGEGVRAAPKTLFPAAQSTDLSAIAKLNVGNVS